MLTRVSCFELKNTKATRNLVRNRQRLECTAISIDRRKHLEIQWQRQLAKEQSLEQAVANWTAGTILPIENLQQLDDVVEMAGSTIVVLGLYSRSCGVCRRVFQAYDAMCKEAAYQQAGVRFLKHDVMDEFDGRTDIALMHKVKTVPTFLFFVDGAVARSVMMSDTRHGIPAQTVQTLMARDIQRLRAIIQELLLRETPSAKR